MKNIEISLQKAVAILRSIVIKEGKLYPFDEKMYRLMFKNFKAGQEILLRTGAKLIMTTEYTCQAMGVIKKYWLLGYHHAGDDVNYYFKKKRRR